MPSSVILTNGTSTLARELERCFAAARPRAVAIASAFVSVDGAQWATRIVRSIGSTRCRLIAGIDHSITHPQALALAKNQGWEVRIGATPTGIFHPKFILAGERFRSNGDLITPIIAYVGSSNLTRKGLGGNTECGFLANGEEIVGTARAFATMWNASAPLTARSLSDYSALFAEVNRRRSAEEIEALGISDRREVTRAGLRRELRQSPPILSTVAVDFASAAWTGLQSFTGEYTFQVEFPRSAGQVIKDLIGGRITAGGYVEVFCEDDRRTVRMRFAFYADNSMFRLNIPNDVTNVEWARTHRDGIALVTRGPAGGAPIRLRIVLPGTEFDEVVGKSVALGTWGRTPTRLYGWF